MNSVNGIRGVFGIKTCSTGEDISGVRLMGKGEGKWKSAYGEGNQYKMKSQSFRIRQCASQLDPENVCAVGKFVWLQFTITSASRDFARNLKRRVLRVFLATCPKTEIRNPRNSSGTTSRKAAQEYLPESDNLCTITRTLIVHFSFYELKSIIYCWWDHDQGNLDANR